VDNFITHDLRKKAEVSFWHDPDPGFLAIVDPGSYEFFAGDETDWPGMVRHVGKQMGKKAAVAWGCPEKHLKIRIRLTEKNPTAKDCRGYAAGFRAWVRTDGVLWFTSDRDLYFCALYEGSEFPRKQPSPDVYCPRKLLVAPAEYQVFVVRHFPWWEGDQDAPELNKGVHYTVMLKGFAPRHPGDIQSRDTIPWTRH
jgi:hypothetical protein